MIWSTQYEYGFWLQLHRQNHNQLCPNSPPSYNFNQDLLILTDGAQRPHWPTTNSITWAYIIWNKFGYFLSSLTGEEHGGWTPSETTVVLHALKDPHVFGNSSKLLILPLIAGRDAPTQHILVDNMDVFWILSSCNSVSLTTPWVRAWLP